jgi:hypothetical protein
MDSSLEIKNFLKLYLENDDDIEFLLKFINDTKKFIKYRKLVILFDPKNIGQTIVLKYIENLLNSCYYMLNPDESINKSINNLIIINNNIKIPVIREMLFNDDIKGNVITATDSITQYIHRTMHDKIKIIQFKNN